LTAQTSKTIHAVFHYSLVICNIVYCITHIIYCLKIYLHQTMRMDFVFFLTMFQDKRNRDYCQCNPNRLHL